MTRAIGRLLAVAATAAALTGSVGCARARAVDATEERASGRPAVAVDVVTVAPADVADAIDVVGSLAPKTQADIESEYSGIVTEVYVTEWVRVQKGAPLARLDASEVATALEAVRAAVLQATVAEARAVREHDRAAHLKEFGLVTEQQLDEARTLREAAAAATTAARAQQKAVETRLAKALIRAPLDGVVSFRGVDVGDRVENMGGGAPMFTIVDTRVLEATVTVPSSRQAAVHAGDRFEFTVDGLPDRSFSGRVQFINPVVDPVTRAVSVQVDVANDDGALKGGSFIKGRIVTGTRAGVLRVPREALLNWDTTARTADVFVVNGERATRQPVTTGTASAGAVEVAGGLSAGQQVVSRGAFNVRDGDRVKVAAIGS
jgi:RND family efflux transporter MFP subunit